MRRGSGAGFRGVGHGISVAWVYANLAFLPFYGFGSLDLSYVTQQAAGIYLAPMFGDMC